MFRRWACALFAVVVAAASASAQFKDNVEPSGPKLGASHDSKWRCGVIITASGGACVQLVGYIPVPMDWPEQRVKVLEEDISPGVTIDYESVGGTAKVMRFRIDSLAEKKEAKAVVTFEVRRQTIEKPEKTDGFKLIEASKIGRDLHAYVVPSPQIESRDGKIRDLAKKIGADKEKAWERIEAIYDWVRRHVKVHEGAPNSATATRRHGLATSEGAVAALRSGAGNAEDATSLFVAVCRAASIPARMVWVQGGCYAEFYLLDAKDQGHWFPCQVAGDRAFGCVPETKPILQKGDSVMPPPPHPHKTKDRERYLAEYFTAKPAAPGGGPPTKQWVRELVN